MAVTVRGAIERGSELAEGGSTNVEISLLDFIIHFGHVGGRIAKGTRKRLGNESKVRVLRNGRSVTISVE